MSLMTFVWALPSSLFLPVSPLKPLRSYQAVWCIVRTRVVHSVSFSMDPSAAARTLPIAEILGGFITVIGLGLVYVDTLQASENCVR